MPNYRITGLTLVPTMFMLNALGLELHRTYLSPPLRTEIDKRSGIPILVFGDPEPIPDDKSASYTVDNYF